MSGPDGDRRPTSSDELPAAAAVVRPLGNPLPLGFFSFAVGMALLAGIGLGLVTGGQVRAAGVLLAAFVFPLEFLAAIIAFLARDTGAASALGIFSTSWAGLGALFVIAPEQQRSVAVGIYLCAFALMLLPIAAVAYLGKALLGIVLTVSVLRVALDAAYQFGAPDAVRLADAAVALLLVALALYAGTAFLLEDARHRTVLPIMRHGEARREVQDETVGRQIRVSREPGIRGRL